MGSVAEMAIGIMSLLIPIVIITIIVVAIVRKNKEGEKTESFEKIVRMIYVYILLICFLFMTVGSVIYAFNSAINYFIPESTVTNKYSVQPDLAKDTNYNEELRALEKENNLRNEKNQSLTDLVTAIAMAVVAVPMFIYHSKLARELKEV